MSRAALAVVLAVALGGAVLAHTVFAQHPPAPGPGRTHLHESGPSHGGDMHAEHMRMMRGMTGAGPTMPGQDAFGAIGETTMRHSISPALMLLLAWGQAPSMAADQLDLGRRAISSMAGCFLVDYSYVETEALRPGYVRDSRVYDVNRDKSVKEWISMEPLSERRLWLQRILFSTDLGGAVRDGSIIRHQSEDWEYDAPFLYEFVAPRTWHVKDLSASPGVWTRKVTNLDDGLRYQCAARWRSDTVYAEWSCSNYAPIPGRETRDMRRADYQTLDRATRLVLYGGSWLERQDNVKTIHGEHGRSPLARETGKNWYVRLPDAECSAGQAFARPRRAFWTLLQETWDSVLTGREPFIERMPAGQPPRFVRMGEVEEHYLGRDLADPDARTAARERILRIIEEYRDR